MTTIQMITNDQMLIGVQKPKVAAGDVNSVTLHVDFDSAWDDFASKSACFHTAKDATVHEVLLTDGECLVPASVLAEEGILFIGIRGVSADGEAVKTSTLVKYKIVAGATASEKTIYPELDMYQQYLAAMDTKTSAMIANYTKTVDEKIAEQDESIDKAIDELSKIAYDASVQLATGSYVGTGKSGADYPNSLTFDFVPKYVRIVMHASSSSSNLCASYATLEFFYGQTFAYIEDISSRSDINVSWNGNTVEWYGNTTVATQGYIQANISNATYYYIAIG